MRIQRKNDILAIIGMSIESQEYIFTHADSMNQIIVKKLSENILHMTYAGAGAKGVYVLLAKYEKQYVDLGILEKEVA